MAVWGYRAMARRLGRQLADGRVHITVIAASEFHGFHGWTGEVLAGLVGFDRTRTPLADLLPRARLVRGVANGVDLEARTVTVAGDDGTRQVAFDQLLVGVGTRDDTGRIPGLAGHGFSVKGDDALRRTHHHLLPATVLSTVGQATMVLPGLDGLDRDASGRLRADAWLRTSHPRVWAGGDAAAVPHVLTGEPCPPNALWAIKHGVRVGDNIVRAVRGRRLRRFRFLGLGQAASLGVGRGAVELYGAQLTGWLGWLARWGFFHWFMPSRRRALATIGDWLARPWRGRSLAPEPGARPTAESHPDSPAGRVDRERSPLAA